jgi:anti-repressor protein
MNGPRIPQTDGVSGTWAALERNAAPAAVELFAYTNDAGHVRGAIVDGEPLFVSADVLAILDLNRSSIALLDEDEKGVHTLDTPGGRQQFSMITESGLYSLILRSRKPDAKVIKRWVTHEVLPAIRKTGAYSRYPAAPQRLPYKTELAQWVIEAETRAEMAEARAAELEPSAVAWDRLHELGADYEVADAAKILSRDPNIEIGRNRLFEFMHDQDWVFRGRHNCWKAYQDQVDNGRLKHRPGEEYFHKGTQSYRTGDPTILLTPKGISELLRLLGGKQQLSLVSAS